MAAHFGVLAWRIPCREEPDGLQSMTKHLTHRTHTHTIKFILRRTSLAVQWLRLCMPTAGGVGSMPGGGTKIPHTP